MDEKQKVVGFWGLDPSVLEDKNPLVVQPGDIDLTGPPPDYYPRSRASIPLCDGYKLGGDVDMVRCREIIRHLIAQGLIPPHRKPWADGRDVHTIVIGWLEERVVLALTVFWSDVIQLERIAVLQAVK